MASPIQCSECAAILEELASAWMNATPELWRAARHETLSLFRSADEESLDELLRKYPFRLQPDGSVDGLRYPPVKLSGFQAAFRRLWDHRASTGHWPLPSR
jgi:muconolactone delta-isomerase